MKTKTEKRTKVVTPDEFRALLKAKLIRAASLYDVEGTHHTRPLYRHPNTGDWFVAVPGW